MADGSIKRGGAETLITLRVDGKDVTVGDQATVLDAARKLGVEVPTLCMDDRVDPAGCCRMCLVEIDGQRRLQPSCTFKASQGMEVRTDTDRVDRHRKVLLSMYAADHSLDETGAPAHRGVGNKLREHVDRYGTGPKLEAIEAPRVGREDANPYIHFDPEACVLCGLCVRYCDEVEAVSAITLAGRGAATTIATADQQGLMDSSCELCGGCIAVCPTGAMTEKPSRAYDSREATTVRSTCNFCGVGCQVDLHVQEGRLVRVTSPDPGTTVNDGNLCVKGRFSYEFVHHEDRLTKPLIRGADGQLHEASWEEALRFAAEGLMRVKNEHGADALGFVSSSRCTGEENYLMQKLSRAAFGTNNCHQCAAT
jgi:predicted molibdopterin-dependent oxidoreductase YjgC